MTSPQSNGNREAGYTAAQLEALTREVRELRDMMRELVAGQTAQAVSAAEFRAAMVAWAARVEAMEKKVEAWEDHAHPEMDIEIEWLKRRDWAAVFTGLGGIGAAVAAWLAK